MISAADPDDNNVAKTVENLTNYVGEPKIEESRRQFLARDDQDVIGFYTFKCLIICLIVSTPGS